MLPHAQPILLQAGSQDVPWWQLTSGVLAIPTAIVGLVYTYRLYKKTHLEMRRLELEIREKERQLGLEREPVRLESAAIVESDEVQLLQSSIISFIAIAEWCWLGLFRLSLRFSLHG